MIAEVALEDPVPSMSFGQHINPDAPFGDVSFVSGPMMAAADELYFTIKGYGAHAAQPHLGRDPILAASGLIHHLQTLITKRRNPLHAGVLTITAINGGHATDVSRSRKGIRHLLPTRQQRPSRARSLRMFLARTG